MDLMLRKYFRVCTSFEEDQQDRFNSKYRLKEMNDVSVVPVV